MWIKNLNSEVSSGHVWDRHCVLGHVTTAVGPGQKDAVSCLGVVHVVQLDAETMEQDVRRLSTVVKDFLKFRRLESRSESKVENFWSEFDDVECEDGVDRRKRDRAQFTSSA
jgi:signal transduction histidine kinase